MLLQDRRIFIVEDNLANRAVTQIALERAGATTSLDRWGHDAVSKIKAFLPIDAILLDLMFPNDLSGYDIFIELQEQDDLRGIPVVAVSGSEARLAIAKTQQYGFSGFIAKPIDLDLFPQQIARILNGEPVWQSR